VRCCTAGILQDSDEDVRNAALAVLKQMPTEAKVATARNLTPSSVSRVDIFWQRSTSPHLRIMALLLMRTLRTWWNC